MNEKKFKKYLVYSKGIAYLDSLNKTLTVLQRSDLPVEDSANVDLLIYAGLISPEEGFITRLRDSYSGSRSVYMKNSKPGAPSEEKYVLIETGEEEQSTPKTPRGKKVKLADMEAFNADFRHFVINNDRR